MTDQQTIAYTPPRRTGPQPHPTRPHPAWHYTVERGIWRLERVSVWARWVFLGSCAALLTAANGR